MFVIPIIITGRILANSDAATIDPLAEMNRIRFGVILEVVQRYLEKCGRQWVSMESIFSFGIAA